VELGYNVTKGPEYFVSLYASVVLTEEYNVMINSEQLIGTTEYLTQQMSCRITRCLHTLISRRSTEMYPIWYHLIRQELS
jgi:hypothetical protein